MPRQNPHARTLRKGRYSRPGLHYFLTTSVAKRRRIFIRHEYASVVLDSIRWLHRTRRLTVDAAVVMPDHVHLAGQLGERSLSRVMHSLKSYTANRLAHLGVAAPIWQPGFHDHALRDDEDYSVRIRYLIDNPVRAGLVERIEDYPYVILPTWWRIR
ncbi:MAG: transposase [Woeseiaceae bacterium]|nr:transposase [Woeseiaceae bacterium]